MTEVIFGDLDSEEDFYKSLKEMIYRDTKNRRRSDDVIDVRADGSWLWTSMATYYLFGNKTWNETKRELLFTVKLGMAGPNIKYVDETNNDAWDDLTRLEWRRIDGWFDDMPCSIEIPKFVWHIPSARDKVARVAYIKANGRNPPPSLVPPEEVEKPEPPATYSLFGRPASMTPPMLDRRRSPPPLPRKRPQSKPRTTRSPAKVAEVAEAPTVAEVATVAEAATVAEMTTLPAAFPTTPTRPTRSVSPP